MTARKIKGIGFLVSGAAFLVTGGVFVFASVTPDWLAAAFQFVGMVAGFFGIKFVYPDTEN